MKNVQFEKTNDFIVMNIVRFRTMADICESMKKMNSVISKEDEHWQEEWEIVSDCLCSGNDFNEIVELYKDFIDKYLAAQPFNSNIVIDEYEMNAVIGWLNSVGYRDLYCAIRRKINKLEHVTKEILCSVYNDYVLDDGKYGKDTCYNDFKYVLNRLNVENLEWIMTHTNDDEIKRYIRSMIIYQERGR